ncbi:MAG: MATE family efflux transporter [Lachnospiraceae bacterium]
MKKIFFKYVFQNVLAMIGISIYILADTFFIAKHSGANGLAVLNIIIPIFGVIYAIGSMIGIGSATKYAIKKACKENTDDYFIQSVTSCIILSIPFVLLGIFCPVKVLEIMGADQTLVELGSNYMKIILLATPFLMTNFTFTSFLRNDNAPRTAMIASMSGSLFNLVFDYILIFTLELGLTGAAIATALSPIVTMLVCSTHFLKKSNNIRFRCTLPKIKHILSCCQFGVPSSVGEITTAITTITFNTLILAKVGNVGVAAYGVIANIAIVVMAIFNGIAQGSQPLISENYGKGNKKNAKEILKLGLIVSGIVTVLILLIIWGKTETWITIFNSDGNKELFTYAYSGMRIYFLGFIFASLNIFLVTYFASIEKSEIALIGSMLRGFIAIILCAIILSNLFGLIGIWSSFFVSEFITFIVIMGMIRKNSAHF